MSTGNMQVFEATGKAFKEAAESIAAFDATARRVFVRPRPFPGIPKLLPALIRLEIGKKLAGVA